MSSLPDPDPDPNPNSTERNPSIPRPSAEQEARSLQLALAAAQIAEDNRGEDVVVLDLRDLTSMFDYFVIASGTSRRQLHAMSDEIDHHLVRELGDRRLGQEGYQGSTWVLLDYGTVVVHLFEAETRGYYAIEKLWGEAPRVPWKVLSEQAKGEKKGKEEEKAKEKEMRGGI